MKFWKCACVLLGLLFCGATVHAAAIIVVDGFDFPVGTDADHKEGTGYHIDSKRHFGDESHLGEDWNGDDGGDSDWHDLVYAIADGVVTYAQDAGQSWGNVIIIRHGIYGQNRPVNSMYGHLETVDVSVDDQVSRGDEIGTIGKGRYFSEYHPEWVQYGGHHMYYAHLHFEIRLDPDLDDDPGYGYGSPRDRWTHPSNFIHNHRRIPLPREGTLTVLTEPMRAKARVLGVEKIEIDGHMKMFQWGPEKLCPAVWNVPAGKYVVQFYDSQGQWYAAPNPELVTVEEGRPTILVGDYKNQTSNSWIAWLKDLFGAQTGHAFYEASIWQEIYDAIPMNDFVAQALNSVMADGTVTVPISSHNEEVRDLLKDAVRDNQTTATARRSAISDFYIRYLLRVPLQWEIDNWFDTSLSIKEIDDAIRNSEEARNQWFINPELYSDRARFDFIRDCVYKHFLGRAPDKQGLESFYYAPLSHDEMINIEGERTGVKASQERREIIDRVWHLYYPHRAYPDAHGNDDARNGFNSITALTRSNLPFDEGDHYHGWGTPTTGIRQLLAGLESDGNERTEYRHTWPALTSWKFQDGVRTNQRYLEVWAQAQDPYYGVGHIEVLTRKEGETAIRNAGFIEGDGSPTIQGSMRIDTLDHPWFHEGLPEGRHQILFTVRNRADQRIGGPWVRDNLPGPWFLIDRTTPETMEVKSSIIAPTNKDLITIDVYVNDKGGGEDGYFELYGSETTNGTIGGANQNHLLAARRNQTTLSYQWKIDRNIFLDGVHRLFVVATDSSGNTYNPLTNDDHRWQRPCYVIIDTTPPWVESFQIISNPDNSRMIRLEVSVRDNFNLDSMILWIINKDGVRHRIGTYSQSRINLALDAREKNIPPGSYSFQIETRDRAGNRGFSQPYPQQWFWEEEASKETIHDLQVDNLNFQVKVIGPEGTTSAVAPHHQPDYHLWEWKISSTKEGTVTLTWPNLRELGRSFILLLRDDAGKYLNLQVSSHYGYARKLPDTRYFSLMGKSWTPSAPPVIINFSRSRSSSLSSTFTVEALGDETLIGEARILSLSGRTITTLSSSSILLSRNGIIAFEFIWDHQDREGRPLPRGAYLLEVMISNQEGERTRMVRMVRVE